MKKTQANILIIEDDFRVANINKEFIEKIDGFHVCGVATTGQQALELLAQMNELPELILLDVYIPDVKGLELMWDIRKKYQQIDIIMITAAKEVDTVEETFRGGVVDYIVKPIDFGRLEQALQRYKVKKKSLENKGEMTQIEIDKLQGFSSPFADKEFKKSGLPKGIDRLTLEKVITAIEKNDQNGVTAVEMGKFMGTSRSTARRYLEYLVVINLVKTELIYGDVGRPERRYVFL